MKLKFVISLMLAAYLALPAVSGSAIQTWNDQKGFFEPAQDITWTNWLAFKGQLVEFFARLNEKRIKDKNDICVWKICSRPLKSKEQPKGKAAFHNMASKYPGLNRKSKIVCFKDVKTGQKTCDIQI
jgi:hypothetical protein